MQKHVLRILWLITAGAKITIVDILLCIPKPPSCTQWYPPPLDKLARTSRNQSELDPTSSDWIKLDPLHNTTCNYITPAYLNREPANLDIEYT